ncbi:breast cancer type 1 susceptibility protein [Sarcoptes scabiei]|nr:breast cancer type 1 susceptibility protein [Sarcoptes scabiei]
MMLNPDYKNRPTAKELLNHSIIKKYERRRRCEIGKKKLSRFINDSVLSINRLATESNSFSKIVWMVLKNLIKIVNTPLKFVWSYMWPSTNHDDFLQNYFKSNSNNQIPCNGLDGYENSKHLRSSSSSSPISNYNRTYLSNYLDQYSDDEDNDQRMLSNYSFDLTSSDEEYFGHNLSTRNLCSTVNRNPQSAKLLSAKLSPLDPTSINDNINAFQNESFKNVIQRLTFDEFSSDEMEMSETEEDVESHHSSISSNSIDSSSPISSRLILNQHSERSSSQRNFSSSLSSSNGLVSCKNQSLRMMNNVSRKNLLKTFDEIEEQ